MFDVTDSVGGVAVFKAIVVGGQQVYVLRTCDIPGDPAEYARRHQATLYDPRGAVLSLRAAARQARSEARVLVVVPIDQPAAGA